MLHLDYNDLFTMDLKYDAPLVANAPTNTTPAAEYSGNISQMTWQVRGREKQSYTFKYDYINRMTEADYADVSASGTITNDKYTEKLSYDIRGNIQTLQRYGYNSNSCAWGLIDNLAYNYGAYGYNPYNKVSSVTENADVSRGFVTQSNGNSYSYDVDGNMTADPNKGINAIHYNHLNLPDSIGFTNNRYIKFLYDAGGNKLRKTVNNNGTVLYTQDYVNGIEYRNSALEAIYHSEGRVTTIDGILKYEYAMKDHLGNTRLMFCDRNGDGVIKPENLPEPSEVTQENHYYAFGMNMAFGSWENTPSVTDNLQQYNGKELNTDFGLNWNDYGARFYDPAIARWNSIDPKSEKYYSISCYAYVKNNPLKFIDPDGRDIILVTKNGAVKLAQETLVRTATGKALWDKYGNSKTDDIYITSQLFVTQMNARGATYKNADKGRMIKGGKIILDMNDKYEKDFTTLDGLDVSRSKGKSIHLVSLNEATFNEKDKLLDQKKYDLATTIYHEMKAHIDINKEKPVDAIQEHKDYGQDHFEGTNGEFPTPGSPADIMILEMLDLKWADWLKEDMERKAEEKKDSSKEKNKDKNDKDK